MESSPNLSPKGPKSQEKFTLAGLVADEMAAVDRALSRRMESPVGPIPATGEHLLAAGGKRLRPMLAVLAARATDTPIEVGIAVGVAAELIHTATLFHDDVVDDGRVRRGRPAARMVYGNGIVVLVGDYCLAQALQAVSDTGVMAAVSSLSATVTEMAEGEVAQLERAGDPEVTVDHYLRVVDRKTASLIAWCARVGGAARPDVDAVMSVYGRAMGRAFQIADDILDCAAEEGVTGKTVGRDLREGKLTLPVLLACDVDPQVRERIRAAMTERGLSAEDASDIMAHVRRAGGVEMARRRAFDLAGEAEKALLKMPASPYRDALSTLITQAVDRET